MTKVQPPRVTEAILESFGADPEFCDAVIGDLAQEFATRVERYGSGAARLWYYREAVLAAPALLRNWLSAAKLQDARRLLNVAGLAYIMTMVIRTGVYFGGFAAAHEMAEPDWISAATITTIWTGLLSVAAPILAGYLAATYEEPKPMIAALAMAFMWAGFMVFSTIWFAVVPDRSFEVSAWQLASAFFITLLGCVIGGALRVRLVSDRLAAGRA